MATRYVSTNGNDSGPGGIDSPWATLVFAGLNAQQGDTVYVTAGTYHAGCEVSADNVAYIALGEVNVIGDGYRSCFQIEGRSHILIRGFNFTNQSGNPFVGSVGGITIRDTGNVSGVGSSYITVADCTFSAINRNPSDVNSYGSPFTVYSFCDERLGHTNVNHIILKNCVFRTCDMDNPGIFHDYIACVGNVSDFLVTGCSIYHDATVYGTRGGTVGMGGGQLLSGYPDYPRKIVVSDNYFHYTGPIDNTVTFPYFTGCKDILCERNVCENFAGGMIIVTEEGFSGARSERQWFRRNILNGTNGNTLVIGTFADNYREPKDVWVTNNTFNKNTSPFYTIQLLNRNTTDNPDGVLGQCRVANNIFNGYPLLENELGDAVEFRNNDYNQGVVVNVSKIDRDLPTWYTLGLFGDYEPIIELDINGSAQKECRGAEEKQWLVRL